MTQAKSGVYIGATATELRDKGGADKAAGVVSQKALFHRRGDIAFDGDALRLSGWNDTGGLVLRRDEISSVERKYSALYGRFIGGLLDSGKPLILGTPIGEIYLLIDRKEFMETTRNKEWAAVLADWLG
ncbi:hypothetical protein [Nocardia pseudobrasiliensis]|uniref:Uncharacterized protein n=1 Tax=Nocardia pseudobrasiliensis TaxID=45979 RepID=A0A370HYA3_9NOCA|nr:hypothetical protein [Nocardia pseudobrasiliensis]RDI63482.1 hypothetical protein DFR76_110179 [Nocardia pseudobrasiliensis]